MSGCGSNRPRRSWELLWHGKCFSSLFQEAFAALQGKLLQLLLSELFTKAIAACFAQESGIDTEQQIQQQQQQQSQKTKLEGQRTCAGMDEFPPGKTGSLSIVRVNEWGV